MRARLVIASSWGFWILGISVTVAADSNPPGLGNTIIVHTNVTGNGPVLGYRALIADDGSRVAVMSDWIRKAGDFAYARGFVSFVPAAYRKASSWMITLVAAGHIRAGKGQELCEWIRTLPTAEQRCAAYLAAGETLLPKDTVQQEF